MHAQDKSKPDSTSKASLGGSPVAYKTLITDSAKAFKGLLTFHLLNDRWYLEIADSMLNVPLLLVNRISQGAGGGQSQGLGYAGDLINKDEVQFIKGPGNKLFLQRMFQYIRATDSSENGLFKAVKRSDLQPIIFAFPVRSYGPGGSMVVDFTDFMMSDNNSFSFDEWTRGQLSIKSYFPDRSYIRSVKCFPLNVEIRTVKSFTRLAEFPATYEFNLSIVQLPRTLMRSRAGDKRIGYFEVEHEDIDADPQDVKFPTMITRWRLEPAPEDVQRYLKGELVEPIKPIVFYIDPATPKKWVPWLIQGVNAWQKAFEKAGFRNAIYALEAPLNDSSWSLEDARHNAIVYKPSYIKNASGPQINDPRTGEILESHINWHHNVMSLLQDWYFAQTAAVDPKARQFPMDDTLMGKLIRFVCTHEVGHTLGLRHNFGASVNYPTDSLRNPHWLKQNGHTPSIMDYARFNYVAQPGDKVEQDELIPKIGVYDEWAIDYGYRWLPPLVKGEEAAVMKKWLGQTVSSDQRLWFGTEVSKFDARCLSEDLGDDPSTAGTYGIRNLKIIMKNLPEWTVDKNTDDAFEITKRMETAVMNQFDRYMFHAADQIAGGNINFRNRSQKGKVIDFVVKEKQERALAFINRELFITPEWLKNPGVYALVGGMGHVYRIAQCQKKVMDKIISYANFENMSYHEEMNPTTAYPFTKFMNDLRGYIFNDLKSRQPIDAARRNLQKRYVERLNLLLTFSPDQRPRDVYYTDFTSIVKQQLRLLSKQTADAKQLHYDSATLIHLTDLSERINEALSLPEKKVEKPE
ncbi:zinc-dependent metalloprotease [Pseudoflavitalea sp. G-6-1-2]|nr:zinc-dependent metalloprotease [Pseudoflavitalea sp. G-6-1-2]